MFAIRVKKAVLEGGEMMRSHVDVFGLLEGVMHGVGEAIGADGATSYQDVEPSPGSRSAVSGEVCEVQSGR